jgi:hypothetical protein
MLLAGMIVAAMGAEPEASKIAVIVGESSFVTQVSVDDLRELYLRRTRLWPNGTRAVAINLPPDNPLRERFSRLVLGRSTQDLVPYWNALLRGHHAAGRTAAGRDPRPYLAAGGGDAVPLEDAEETGRTLLVLER